MAQDDAGEGGSDESTLEHDPIFTVDAPRADHGIFQAFPQEATPIGTDPNDGLPRPRPLQQVERAEAPPLDPDTFVCMADQSSFVLRRGVLGEVLVSFEPHEVIRARSGRWLVPTPKVVERLPQCWRDEAAMQALAGDPGCGVPVHYHGVSTPTRRYAPVMVPQDEAGMVTPAVIVQNAIGSAIPLSGVARFGVGSAHWHIDDEWCEVEPVRPACAYYARQANSFQDDPERIYHERVCTARRTDGGEFLSVRDQMMFACELRHPRDSATEDHVLDAFDAKLVAASVQKKRAAADVFDVDQALATEEQAAPEATEGGTP